MKEKADKVKQVTLINGDLRDAIAQELSAHKDEIVKVIVAMLKGTGDWADVPVEEKLKNKKEAIRMIEVFTRGKGVTLDDGEDDTSDAGDGQSAVKDASVSAILGDLAEIEESNECGRVTGRP